MVVMATRNPESIPEGYSKNLRIARFISMQYTFEQMEHHRKSYDFQLFHPLQELYISVRVNYARITLSKTFLDALVWVDTWGGRTRILRPLKMWVMKFDDLMIPSKFPSCASWQAVMVVCAVVR